MDTAMVVRVMAIMRKMNKFSFPNYFYLFLSQSARISIGLDNHIERTYQKMIACMKKVGVR